MKLMGWVFLLIGTFLIGIGQNISEEAYTEWSELLAAEILGRSN